jgi:hypothetical protein
VSTRLSAGLLAALFAATLVAGSSAPAGAVGPTSHVIAGLQGSVGCLSTSRCVVGGYNAHGIGDVVAVNDGVPGHISVVAGTVGIDSISCPNRSGCVAVAHTSNGEDAEFVSINSNGAVSGTKKVVTSTGDVVDQVSCVSLTNCETSGLDVLSTPAAYEIGTWNGTNLVVHRVAAPPSSKDTLVDAISCFASTCDVVGYIENGIVITGISIRVTGGDHFAVHTTAHDLLDAVSCTSTTACYADGTNTSGGVVVKLVNGLLTASVATVTSDFSGIGCVGSSCVVVGKENAVAPSHNAYWGTIYVYSAGTLSSPQVVELSSGYESAARVAGTYAAIGLAQSANSEVTTGTV